MSTDVGRAAEDAAAEYLRKHGHKILQRNWRTRWCEIDIVSQKGTAVYFTEVKYRKNSYFGDGLEYVTNTKLKQMTFAAELWLASHDGYRDCSLLAVSVSGESPVVQELVEL